MAKALCTDEHPHGVPGKRVSLLTRYRFFIRQQSVFYQARRFHNVRYKPRMNRKKKPSHYCF